MRDDPPPGAGSPGVYVHVPFCAVKCTYCDFPVAAGQDHRSARYLDALEREIATHGPALDDRVDSVYLGGGTPSRLEPEQVARVLRAVRARFGVADDTEVTLEANPEDLDDARLAGFAEAGVDRLSIGIQSLDDAVLLRAGRVHDGRQALDAVARARAYGFRSVSADLIGGLPGERMERWSATLERVLRSEPDHISFYLLEIDQSSALAKAVRAGREKVADDDDQAAAFEATADTLEEAGFEPYEISNYARAGHRSRHNGKYWGDAWYAGFGLGAHAYALGERRSNVRGLTAYIRAVEDGRDPLAETDPWNVVRRIEEALFLGLRRAEGIDPIALGARYRVDLPTAYDTVWDRHVGAGLLTVDRDRIALTRQGRLRSNTVFRDIVGHLDADAPGEIRRGMT